MADDSEPVVPPYENRQGAPPANMLDYEKDVLTAAQQEALDRFKINKIRETHTYMAEHPEVTGAATLVARELFLARPRRPRQFAAARALDGARFDADLAHLVRSRPRRDWGAVFYPCQPAGPAPDTAPSEGEKYLGHKDLEDPTVPGKVDSGAGSFIIISGLRAVERLPLPEPSDSSLAGYFSDMLVRLAVPCTTEEYLADMLVNLAVPRTTEEYFADMLVDLAVPRTTEEYFADMLVRLAVPRTTEEYFADMLVDLAVPRTTEEYLADMLVELAIPDTAGDSTDSPAKTSDPIVAERSTDVAEKPPAPSDTDHGADAPAKLSDASVAEKVARSPAESSGASPAEQNSGPPA